MLRVKSELLIQMDGVASTTNIDGIYIYFILINN